GWLDLVRCALAACGPEWEMVRERAERRAADPPRPPLAARVWQRVSLSGPDADPTLTDDLRTAGEEHALALLARSPSEAEPHLSRAAVAGNRVSAVGRAPALVDLDRGDEAVNTLRSVLAELAASPALSPVELAS